MINAHSRHIHVTPHNKVRKLKLGMRLSAHFAVLAVIDASDIFHPHLLLAGCREIRQSG
jgi:hypothetical protein